MLIKTRRSVSTVLGSLLLLISFQNCTPQNFSTLEQASLTSEGTKNSVSQNGVSASSGNAVTPAANSSSNTSHSAPSSSQNSAATNNSAANNSGSVSNVTSCSTYTNFLNWDPNEEFKIEMGGTMTQELGGTKPEIPAYSGFGIAFSTNRMGTHVFNPINFLVASSGFSIRIEEPGVGAVELPTSAFADPNAVASKTQAVIASWNSGGTQVGSRAGFFVNRDYYFSNLTNFKVSKVSLYCNGKLVASGKQDVRVLDFELNTIFARVPSGGYTFRDKERSAFVNINCPLEVKSGNPIQCTAAGVGMASGYWIVDGKEDRSFDNQTTYVMSKALYGNHTFQAVVKYTSGLEDRSEIFLVKAR